MHDERPPSKKPRKSTPAFSSDELMRYTEEQLAVARELVKLPQGLRPVAVQLREFALQIA
jgi:hypothetical protein